MKPNLCNEKSQSTPPTTDILRQPIALCLLEQNRPVTIMYLHGIDECWERLLYASQLFNLDASLLEMKALFLQMYLYITSGKSLFTNIGNDAEFRETFAQNTCDMQRYNFPTVTTWYKFPGVFVLISQIVL